MWASARPPASGKGRRCAERRGARRPDPGDAAAHTPDEGRCAQRGRGCLLYDVHGREYIDGISGLWVVNAGHGRQEIGDAMAAQAGKLAYVSAASYTAVPTVQLSEIIAELTPGDLERVFFCSGGSEAVESALKIAKQVQALRGF